MALTYTVTLPYDPVWRALEWAKMTCPSYITNKMTKGPGTTFANRQMQIDYVFGDQRDAVLFALKWQ